MKVSWEKVKQGKENFMTSVVWGICLSLFYNNGFDREQKMLSVRDQFNLR